MVLGPIHYLTSFPVTNHDHPTAPYTVCNGKDGADQASTSAWGTVKTEMQHLQRSKQELEQSFDRLKSDLKLQKILEGELRSQLSQVQHDHQQQRVEAVQFKAKVEQLEGKCRNLAKQNETLKGNAGAMEKRVSEIQAKRAELEKDLAAERLNSSKQQCRDDFWTGGSKSNEFNDSSATIHSLKVKTASLEREVKSLKRELRSKDEQVGKGESKGKLNWGPNLLYSFSLFNHNL